MSSAESPQPRVSKDWLDYEASHGGRFCLAGSAEEIIQQVQDLTDKITTSEVPFNDALETYDTTADGVAVRVYKPKKAQDPDSLPLCLFSHGGGFITGSLDSEDGLCRFIANCTPCVVVSVDYRLGPKHKLPAMFDDVISVFEWVRNPVHGLVTSSTKIFTLGASAGGALSLGVGSHACKSPSKSQSRLVSLTGVVALNPVTLHPENVPAEHQDTYTSYEENDTDVPVMGAGAMRTYLAAVDANPEDAAVFTALSSHHERFPPTYIVTCGLDPLRDDGLVMERMLRKSGVATKLDEYPGLPHIFWIFSDFAMTRVFGERLLAGIKFVLESP